MSRPGDKAAAGGLGMKEKISPPQLGT